VRSTSDARCPSVCVCVCVTGSARMGELVVVSSELQLQWARMKRGIHLANRISTSEEQSGTFGTVLRRAIHDSVGRCRVQRKRAREAETPRDTSDAAIVRAARFTDVLPLDDYDNVLHLVPRLVNVVTVKQHSISNHPTLHNTTHTRAGLPPIQCVLRAQLAEAIPVPGSGIKLPLDLHAIASRCSNSYYAPRRFAAVQLAFDAPRCRVLIFHTGRLVGTGCSGPMAARLAILRATRQLAVEAGVFVHVRNFQVINQVGAVSIDARLDLDSMAETHSATSHYDRQSFVGLAWRPPGESMCCEIYSTGRANLPGSTRERDMIHSFSRMLPELLRHSDRKDVLGLLKEERKQAHRPRAVQRDDATAQEHADHEARPQRSHSLWDVGDLEGSELPEALSSTAWDEEDEALLDGAGF